MTDNNLDQKEEISLRNFEITHPDANKYALKSLEYLKLYILNLGPISYDDCLKSTINMFTGSNYDLLQLSFNILKRGYLRPAVILLRPVFESIILCMYFIEFPGNAEEYRNMITAKEKLNWLRKQGSNFGMIERIKKEGKIFNTHKSPDFLTNIVANPLSEINNVTHFNEEYLFYFSGKLDIGKLYLGPREIEPKVINTLIVHIMQATVLSINILSKSIKPFAQCNESDFKSVVDYLNKLKGIINASTHP